MLSKNESKGALMKTSLISAIVVCGLAACMAPAIAQVAITGGATAPTSPVTGAPASAEPARRANPESARAQSSGTADEMLAGVADTYKHAVGVVVVVVPGRGAIPIGTAWAYQPNLFATNAHVIAAMADAAKQVPDAPFYIAINGRPDKRLKIVARRAHPEYGKTETRFDGRTAISGYDIGILRTAETAPAHFKLATKAQFEALRAGARVAYLGFPMESLVGNNVDVQMPIATMQSGIVTSISDNFLGDSGPENNRLIRHNLPSAGGASGSPVFTPDGVVVAIHWGGNINVRLAMSSDGKVAAERSSNAALVNFAERIDALAGVPVP
jgi:V8-like Glu-specific endopeptidase